MSDRGDRSTFELARPDVDRHERKGRSRGTAGADRARRAVGDRRALLGAARVVFHRRRHLEDAARRERGEHEEEAEGGSHATRSCLRCLPGARQPSPGVGPARAAFRSLASLTRSRRISFALQSRVPSNRAMRRPSATRNAAGSTSTPNAAAARCSGSGRYPSSDGTAPPKNSRTTASVSSWPNVTTDTPGGGSRASARSPPTSSRHGGHHVAQKTTSVAGVRVGDRTAGAGPLTRVYAGAACSEQASRTPSVANKDRRGTSRKIARERAR